MNDTLPKEKKPESERTPEKSVKRVSPAPPASSQAPDVKPVEIKEHRRLGMAIVILGVISLFLVGAILFIVLRSDLSGLSVSSLFSFLNKNKVSGDIRESSESSSTFGSLINSNPPMTLEELNDCVTLYSQSNPAVSYIANDTNVVGLVDTIDADSSTVTFVDGDTYTLNATTDIQLAQKLQNGSGNGTKLPLTYSVQEVLHILDHGDLLIFYKTLLEDNNIVTRMELTCYE